ncbi:MAG: DNA polymerase III subunit delta' [Candidatus Aminicenantes bacterium RBG_16_63_16]|nr:MAG: DNA polymerase III subunit delta' [Candidatus Aminicenantes bacterium RBG_16_63_16]
MAFKDVAGNVRIKRTLKLALERTRVPNSLLFCGPEGVGKKAMALTLAKALNCLNLTTDSCDACRSCEAIDKGVHPDVMVIAAEKQEIKIEQTRFLKQMAYLRPMTGKKRVFIVVDAAEMSDAAANSLLKVLEEPPLHSHLILVTASPFLLFPTILSRCQTLAFSAIGREEIEEILLERNFGTEQARILALLVDGNLERALDLEWEDVQSLKEESWALFEALASGDRSALFLERFGTLAKAVQEEFGRTLEVFSSFVRDILLLRLGGDPQFLLNPDFEPRLREASAAWTVRRVLGVLEELDFVLTELPKNLNKGLLATTFFSNFGELRHV